MAIMLSFPRLFYYLFDLNTFFPLYIRLYFYVSFTIKIKKRNLFVFLIAKSATKIRVSRFCYGHIYIGDISFLVHLGVGL